MQSDFLAPGRRTPIGGPSWLQYGTEEIPLELVRNPRARRYILRVLTNGSARVTLPRGGSVEFALGFAHRHADWILRELRKRKADAAQRPRIWTEGTTVLFRGEETSLRVQESFGVKLISFADQLVPIPLATVDFRLPVQNHLWSLAEKELIPRTLQLAAHHQVPVGRIVIRNQRSRWGSCSPARTISLNWRLIQAPPSVRDYLITHELMHLREMNHSRRFWRLVEAACPEFAQAEAWLDRHSHLLRG